MHRLAGRTTEGGIEQHQWVRPGRDRAIYVGLEAADCAGLPVAPLPPKKKTTASGQSPALPVRRAIPAGNRGWIFRSPWGVVLYNATALSIDWLNPGSDWPPAAEATGINDSARSTARSAAGWLY